MLYRTTFLAFILAFGAAAAFAVPSNGDPSRPTEGIETYASPEENNLGFASGALHSQSAVISQKKMKSNTLRWFVRGVIGELYHNIFLRQINRLRAKCSQSNNRICRQLPKNEIAIVTGATGGIGSHMAHELALRGYDVIIAARDMTRGTQLVNEIKDRLAEIPTCEDKPSGNANVLPTISFVEYHADNPESALEFASTVKALNRQVTVLINNAGIMGKSKQLTMKVNLMGPVLLTLALLPLMDNPKSNATVINVGSSAHLRATQVIDEEITLGKHETYIHSLPSVEDNDLSTYSQSKLALMQFSTLLRNSLAKSNSRVAIYDAHPGLVWTPLLRNHIGEKATNTLRKTGLANLIYKTPLEGAQAIIAALDYVSKGQSESQVYFENGKPGGFATHESRDYSAAGKLWNHVIEPELRGVMESDELPFQLRLTS